MIRAGDRFKRSRWISNSRRQFLGALLVHYNLQMRPSGVRLGSVGAGERLCAWRSFRENLLGGGRKIVHVAEKCHRLPNLLRS